MHQTSNVIIASDHFTIYVSLSIMSFTALQTGSCWQFKIFPSPKNVMHKCSHMVCKVHAGLGVGIASGFPSAADKNIHKSPQARSVYDGEREQWGEVYLTGGGEERNKDRRG